MWFQLAKFWLTISLSIAINKLLAVAAATPNRNRTTVDPDGAPD
jgi:hypothetical protein